MADAGPIRPRQFQRGMFVIVPGPQIGAASVLSRQLQPIDTGKKIKTFVEAVGQHLDMAEMRDVMADFHHSSSTVRGKTDWNPSAYSALRPPDWPPELRMKWLARF